MPRGVRVTNEQVDAVLAPLKGERGGDVFTKTYGKAGKRQSYVLVRWACGHEAEVTWKSLRLGTTTGCRVRSCPQSKWRAAISARREQERLAAFTKAKTEAEAEGYTLTLLPDLRPAPDANASGGIRMISWVSCVCPEGHEHEKRLGDWLTGYRCPDCAISGYQTSKPGTLYLCARTVHGAEQRMYGISNVPDKRLAEHAKRGWVLLDRIDGGGQRIAEFERTITEYMKANGLHGSIYAGDDGETEAWAHDDLPIDSIRRLMNTVMNARAA